MTVSILMPSYRGGDYLVEAMKSIEAQTYTDYRLLIADTSGERKAVAALMRFGKPFRDKVEIFARPKADDAGAAAQDFLTLKAWDGEGYACLMHDDDLMHPDRLLDQASYMMAFDCDITFTYMAHAIVPKAGGVAEFQGGKFPTKAVRPDLDKMSYDLTTPNPTPAWPTLMFNSRFRDIPIPEGYRCGAQDRLYLLRAWAAGLKFGVVPEALYFYRLHHGEVGNSGTPANVESTTGFARFGRDVFDEEMARMVWEAARMGADISYLSVKHGREVRWIAPGRYALDGDEVTCPTT
jgi:glycosyltransferase involved in cell wall biosynthesis